MLANKLFLLADLNHQSTLVTCIPLQHFLVSSQTETVDEGSSSSFLFQTQNHLTRCPNPLLHSTLNPVLGTIEPEYIHTLVISNIRMCKIHV